MEETAKKQIYELGYHVLPTLSEDEVTKVVSGIKDLLSSAEAVVIAEQFPQMMNLAYEIGKELENKVRKYGSAYFGWIKFEISTSEIAGFKDTMEKMMNIFRFIII